MTVRKIFKYLHFDSEFLVYNIGYSQQTIQYSLSLSFFFFFCFFILPVSSTFSLFNQSILF